MQKEKFEYEWFGVVDGKRKEIHQIAYSKEDSEKKIRKAFKDRLGKLEFGKRYAIYPHGGHGNKIV